MKLHFNRTGMMEILRLLYKGIFGSIAVLAFLGNLLLCFVICRRRDLLSKPYNILILNLTATDLLTGMSKHYYSNKSYSPVAQWLERPSKYKEGREFDSHLGLGIFF